MSAKEELSTQQNRAIARDEGVQRFDALSRFVGRFAHDFSNVLATIVLNVTLIEKKCTDPTVLRFARSALRAADRGTGLARRLLAYAGKQQLTRAPTDLGLLILGMRDLLSRTAGAEVELVLRSAKDLWPVSVDTSQIEFALVNLVANAHDAMPRGGTLTVELANTHTTGTTDLAAGDYVAVSLKDTGQGVSNEALQHAFEPFFTTRPGQKHLGLGLSAVLGIAMQHGGTARLAPAAGGGCRAEIFLPRATEAERRVSGDSEPASRRARQLAKITVLVVDDDPDLRIVAQDGLESLGCDVLVADSGVAALQILASHPPVDLLMVDVRMVGMSGVELLRRARALRPGLKALVMTGGADVPELSGSEAATAMLRKPFRADDLAQSIAAVMSGDERRTE